MELKFVKVMNATLHHGPSMAWNIAKRLGQFLITGLYFLAW